MATKAKTDGTIYQFLSGSHSFQGVWFGDKHPDYPGQKFWWREFLPKAKPETAWAVFDANGEIKTRSVRFWRKDSISYFEKNSKFEWEILKKYGFTCRKIQITEVVK
jgi:hypothetical protein